MSFVNSNINVTDDMVDQELEETATPPPPPSTNMATTFDEVLDNHFPQQQQQHSGLSPQTQGPKPTVDRIIRANQDAISQYDDLKLATYVTEHENTDTTSTHHVRSNDPEFRQQLYSIDHSNYDDGSGTDSTISLNFDGLTSDEAERRLQLYGPNSIPKSITQSKFRLFCTQLFGSPMPIMIWVAVVILVLINNILDAIILCIIQFTNATISFYEMNKAGDAVAALQLSLQPTATVKRNQVWETIPATLLVPGDAILLSSGVNVPADCRINNPTPAYIDVDQSAITGESLPITFYKGDSCKMGSTVVRGEVEVTATVEFTGSNTFFGKTAKLVQHDSNERSHLQKILVTIMYVLVGLSVVLCTLNFLYLLSRGEDVEESLSFTIVLLVASIPLAIEIVTTTTLAIGSKTLAKHGAIVTKLSAIEDLAGMSILCSDKTGTLTLNQMVLLQEDDDHGKSPIYDKHATASSVLLNAALASKWNEPPRDAVDRLILGGGGNENGSTLLDKVELQKYEQLNYVPFDPLIKRTESTIRNKETSEEYKVSKGAPHIILDLLPKTDASNIVRQKVERDVAKYGERGIRSLAVARTNNDDEWYMIGLLTFLDPPRADTKETIRQTREHGVQVKMITGDHLLIARNTALQLDMGDKIFTADRLPLLDPETQSKPFNLSQDYGDLCLVADGFAQVYPEHKYLIVECLRELGYTVGMTGDGVNDAPALKRADIGIAVAGATDAARAASDIVLTEPGLGTISQGIILSRHIFQRMSNFITYRISATLQLLLFFFLAVLFLHPARYESPDELDRDIPWPEFFHMPIIMMMLITVLNDGTLITIAYDNTEASQTPNRWNLRALFVVSSVLGGVSCISSLILLHYLLDSSNPNGLLHKIGIQNVQYGQIITSIYLKVSVSDFLTLFSARTGPRFFWKIRPAPTLLAGGIFALSISSLVAILWPDSEPDGILTEGLLDEMELFVFVWVYCLVFWLIQDVAKVIAYSLMYRCNYGNIKGNGVVQLPDSARQLLVELEEASERGTGTSSRLPSSIV